MLKGRQMMGVRSKETLKLGGYIFTSFLLATVQNHEAGGVAAQCQPAPAPGGSGAKYKKNHKYSMGVGLGIQYIVVCRGRPCSQPHTRTQNSQRYRLQKSIIPQAYSQSKISGPQQTQSQKTAGEPGTVTWKKGQVKTGREHTEAGERLRKETAGDGQQTSRDSQKRDS